MDVIRGTGNQKWLSTNSVSAEGIAYNNANVTSLDSDGFTVGTTGGTNQLNATSRAPVAWNWKAGGSGSANTNGSISSTVSVNADAGFSIVEYTETQPQVQRLVTVLVSRQRSLSRKAAALTLVTGAFITTEWMRQAQKIIC